MQWLIWTGAAVTLLGVLGLAWCVRRALAVRRAALPEAEARAALQAIVPWNLAALFLSALGLMLVVVGIHLA